MPVVQNFVRAEMLPSGYLIRPCEGGGSIIHVVDHLDLEVHDCFTFSFYGETISASCLVYLQDFAF